MSLFGSIRTRRLGEISRLEIVVIRIYGNVRTRSHSYTLWYYFFLKILLQSVQEVLRIIKFEFDDNEVVILVREFLVCVGLPSVTCNALKD